jgi:NAD(P)-dependent dehydrogenase (short-subunit alcohol dehydrogenase family)
LKDRVALVTGASRGLGASAAVALAKEGAHIIATARTEGGLAELDDQIKAWADRRRWFRSTSGTSTPSTGWAPRSSSAGRSSTS